MKLKTALLLFFTIFQFELHASCVDALKDVLSNKPIKTTDIIEAKKVFKKRIEDLPAKLEGAKIKRIIQGTLEEVYFKEYLSKVETNARRKQIINLILETYNNNNLIKDWAETSSMVYFMSWLSKIEETC